MTPSVKGTRWLIAGKVITSEVHSLEPLAVPTVYKEKISELDFILLDIKFFTQHRSLCYKLKRFEMIN